MWEAKTELRDSSKAHNKQKKDYCELWIIPNYLKRIQAWKYRAWNVHNSISVLKNNVFVVEE